MTNVCSVPAHLPTPMAMPGLACAASGLTSDDAQRTDAACLAQLWRGSTTRALVFCDGKILVDKAGHPRPILPHEWDMSSDHVPVFLGMDGADAAWFCVDVTAAQAQLLGLSDDDFVGLRSLLPLAADTATHTPATQAPVPQATTALNAAGTARSLLMWHARNGFCAACGAPTAPSHGGWRRVCPACGTEHFPRIDPVVIMAIGRMDPVAGPVLLLGRQAGWPEGRYSCLAGFMEPGETPETCVAREAREEAGVAITTARYVGAQPWPFPHSLMLGFIASTDTATLTVDRVELEDARWFSTGDISHIVGGTHPELSGPPPLAIAHHLIVQWLADHTA